MQADTELICPLNPEGQLPDGFPSPFDSAPHALARQACELLKLRLPILTPSTHDYEEPAGGKMLGALVVRLRDSSLGYLSGFSGMLGGRWVQCGFVPPAFNLEQREAILPAGEIAVEKLGGEVESILRSTRHRQAVNASQKLLQQQALALAELKALHRQRREQRAQIRLLIQQGEYRNTDGGETIESLAAQSSEDKREYRDVSLSWQLRVKEVLQRVDDLDRSISDIKMQRRQLSRQLQQRVFEGYKLQSATGEHALTTTLFHPQVPPGGAGDCVAIKLLQSCYKMQLEPVCMAEFWWGATPSSEIRHHGYFYPACRGKCGPILPFMLQGLNISLPAYQHAIDFTDEYPRVIYEDSSLLVVEKPAGMLSVPGKQITDSVEQRLQHRYPGINTTMLVHRLDQATSGLLIAAKSANVRSQLQGQFQRREVEKKYIADKHIVWGDH